MDPVKLEGETLPEGNPPSARQEGPFPRMIPSPLVDRRKQGKRPQAPFPLRVR